MMKVCKFGGSSLADAEQLSKVCDIITSDPERRIVVVSAPGKRHSDDTKVTDLLIDCARKKLEGGSAAEQLRRVVDRFADIQHEFGLDKDVVELISNDLNARLERNDISDEEFIDMMKAAGEDNCAKLVAAALRLRGADANYIDPREAGMLLSDEFGNARLLPESYEKLSALRNEVGIVVFPGFFGYTVNGAIATFPRGGSDITGSIITAAVHADLYENFSDIDSVFAVDPRIAPDAEPIPELSYHEMRELSYAGFAVLHDEAIAPVVHASIPICIKNTNRPDSPGTMIVPKRNHKGGRVVGIAASVGFCTIFVSKYLMNREVGFGRRLLQILEEEGLSYEHMPSGIDNMSIILRQKDIDLETRKKVMERIRSELGADDVDIELGLALIMIVGEGMRFAVGVATKATKALSDAGVNIEMMNQGSSEISMMFGVKGEDSERAVKSLYSAFFDK